MLRGHPLPQKRRDSNWHIWDESSGSSPPFQEQGHYPLLTTEPGTEYMIIQIIMLCSLVLRINNILYMLVFFKTNKTRFLNNFLMLNMIPSFCLKGSISQCCQIFCLFIYFFNSYNHPTSSPGGITQGMLPDSRYKKVLKSKIWLVPLL